MERQKRLDILRALLAGGPSPIRWRYLCDLFEAWPEDSSLHDALTSALPSLERWPSYWRKAPQHWFRQSLTQTSMHRLMTLVRHLSLHGPLDADTLARFRVQPWLSQIRGLTLSHSDLDPEGMLQLFSTALFPNLESLVCVQTGAFPLGQAFLQSPSLSGLTALELRGISLDHESWDALFSQPWLPELVHLKLHPQFQFFPDRHLRAFSSPGAFPKLTTLALTACSLEANSAQQLAEWSGLSQLEVLNLQQNRLLDKGVEALVRSRRLGALRFLGLGHNSLGNTAFQALAACKELAGLQQLDLSYNLLDDQCLRALAVSPHLQQLRALHLTPAYGMREYTAEGIQILANSSYLSDSIRASWLEHC